MYLKSIDVQGFKSFANKLTFEFHNGITGIVGPNGSGKSNVADAVRWVLGEQSAKQLRGGNMQDVIFSGTELRKPQGFASVAITLDNSDHKLDIDFEEVTVTRRLYRSGESEYLLNGSPCRLKDINELFYDTGIGREGYSIIGQGQVEQILSGKPEERRELFDEAAGIVKFKRRKNAAVKKLEEEQQNMLRVTDILKELTGQIEPLEKQSAVAKIYLQKKDELKQMDVNLFLIEMDRIKTQLAEIEEKYSVAQKDLQDANVSFEQTKQEYEKLEHDMEALDESIADLREKIGKDAVIKQQLEGQIDVLREQINAYHQNDEHYRTRAESIEADVQKRTQELDTYKEEQASLAKQLASVEKAQQTEADHLQEITAKIDEITGQIESGKSEIIDILNQRAATKGKTQRYETMLEQIGIRKAELSQRVLRLKSDENEQNKELAKHQKKETSINEKIEKLLSESKQCDRDIDELQKTIAEQNKQMDVGQTAFHRESSKLESLRNLTERYDGYGNGIRKVMEQKDNNSGILGVVADLIQVKKKYEMAIETALGGSIRNIVTADDATAKKMISFLKINKFGRATFLPLPNLTHKRKLSNPEALQEEGVIGLASDLVKTDSQYAVLPEYLLGRTLVVDQIDHALAIAKKYNQSLHMVTVEGESFAPGGSITGGAFKNNSNLLGRRREIEELEQNVSVLKTELEQMVKSIEANRTKRNHKRERSVILGEKLQEQYILLNTAQLGREQAESKCRTIREGYMTLNEEQREIEAQIREIEQNNHSIRQELKEFETREQTLESDTKECQSSLDALIKQRDEQQKVLEERHMDVASASQKNEFITQNVTRVEDEVRLLQDELASIQSHKDDDAAAIAEKEDHIKKITETIESSVNTARQDEEKISSLTEQKAKMTESHKGFFEKRDELSERMNLLDKECFRLNNQKERLDESRDNQISYMWEEYELSPSSAQPMRLEEKMDRAELKRNINLLKDTIRKLGNVNVNAIEDFKNLSERHEFLQTQYDDLVKSEETLMGIIEELDQGMRKQFTEKFAQIQVEFDKAFKDLFGGGKGSLELMEDEDVLTAGVKIISQPPGKKLQNMMQLSGGEKALTAIALLFAIQNLKPSPFCLLDEIEAALDDSNVIRFSQYLYKLTKNTQFIVITHRRGTMTAADRLYGITMQEKGVSTLVSVNLIEKDLDN